MNLWYSAVKILSLIFTGKKKCLSLALPERQNEVIKSIQKHNNIIYFSRLHGYYAQAK